MDSHAQSTAANVNEDNLQLQEWKQTLDDCNELIHAKSLEVDTHAGVVERFAEILGERAGMKLKRSMEFKRQKKAMEELSQTLDEIHSQVPLLLPQGEKMKFLDNFSCDSESEENLWIMEVEEMPPVTFHAS